MTTQIEEEQLEQVRNWWEKYGKTATLAVLIVVAIVCVWRFWQYRQQTQKMMNSLTYQQLLSEVQKPVDQINITQATLLANKLESESPNSVYAQFGQLSLAALAVEKGSLDDAANALQKVLKKPATTYLAEIAKQRLAIILSAQNKTEEALKLLDTKVDKSFIPSHNEIKGDLLLKLGRIDEARKAYDEAMTAAKEDKSPNQLTLQLKLNDLGQEGA